MKGAWRPASAALLCAVVLTALFGLHSYTSPWAFPRFALAAALLAYVPGRWIAERGLPGADPVEKTAVALVAGMVATTGLYAALARLSLRGLFLAWPVLALAAALHELKRRPPARTALPAGTAWAALPILVAWAALAALPLHYRNLARARDGLSLYPLPDLFFHLSIANELTHALPPRAPFLPGHGLDYHYAADLWVALLAESARLSVPDLSVRFVPTLWFAMAGLSAFAFGRAWLGSTRGGALFAFLVLFGEDLAFLPGLLAGTQGVWAVDFFSTPTLVSLFMLNPMLPALSVLFTGLLCLHRFEAGAPRGAGVLGGLLVGATAAYKVFAGVQMVGALLAACALCAWRARDLRLAGAAALGGALALLLALPGGADRAEAEIALRSSPLVPNLLVRAGLFGTWLGDQVRLFWTGHGSWREGALAFWGLALPTFLVGALGARLLAIPGVVEELRAPGRRGALRLALVIFVLVGPPLGMTLSITPAGYPGEGRNNEAIWFFVQSKYLAWALALEPFVGFWRRQRAPARAAALLALLALCLPSSAQYLTLAAREPLQRLGAGEMAALDALRREARPGDVVLAGPRLSRAVIGLTSCHAVVVDLFTLYYQSKAERDEWAGELDQFWSGWARGALRHATLQRFGARFVLIEAARDPAPPSSARLVLDSGDVRLYALDRARRE